MRAAAGARCASLSKNWTTVFAPVVLEAGSQCMGKSVGRSEVTYIGALRPLITRALPLNPRACMCAPFLLTPTPSGSGFWEHVTVLRYQRWCYCAAHIAIASFLWRMGKLPTFAEPAAMLNLQRWSATRKRSFLPMIDFTFVLPWNKLWFSLVHQAQASMPEDPNTCLFKLRLLAERIAQGLAAREAIHVEGSTFLEVLEALEMKQVYDSEIEKHFHSIRRKGNRASHEHDATEGDATAALKSAYAILVWYARRYVDIKIDTAAGDQHPAPEAKLKTEVIDPEYLDPAPVALGIERAIPLAQKVAILATRAISLLREVEQSPSGTESILAVCKRRIAAAAEPFRLGVIGDARAGKSTLINAVAGDNLAFTSVIEATPVVCSFRRGEVRAARIVYRDGNLMNCTVESANQVLRERRHDVEWIASVDHIEFTTTKNGLGDLELWDAPGFGGSDHNDVTAGEFLSRVSGAIWVFDCQFLGAADHIAPLRILNRAGKRVVGVLNKVDILQEDEYELALSEAVQRYGEYIRDFALLSATQAYSLTSRDARDERLELLLSKLHSQILDNAISDREHRIRAAIQSSAADLAVQVEREQRALAARLGFVNHISRNLELAHRHAVTAIDGFLNSACESLFSPEERAARLGVAQLCSAGPSLTGGELDDVFKRIMRKLDSDTPLGAAYRSVTESVVNRVGAMWNRECVDAVRLSAAAIPDLAVQFVFAENSSAQERDGSGGLGFAAIAAGILGFIAATALHWPLLLAFVPAALVEGWEKFRVRGEIAGRSLSEMQDSIQSFVMAKRRFLQGEVSNQLRSDIQAILATEVSSLRAKCEDDILCGMAPSLVQTVSRQLLAVRRELGQLAGDGMRWDTLDVRPLRLTTDPEGASIWIRLLSSAATRVDLLAPTIDASLVPLLSQLRPQVEVRVVTTNEGPFESVLWPLRTWKGEWTASVVRMSDGSRVDLRETLILFDGDALITASQIAEIGRTTVILDDYPDGSLAAQRFFAEMWEGKCSRFGAMSCARFHQSAHDVQKVLQGGHSR